MTGRTKFQVVNSFRDSLMTKQIIIRSVPLVHEMLNVRQEGSEIGAPDRLKDDRVFGAILAHMAWQDWVKPGMMQRGATYDAIRAEEAGDKVTPAHRLTNRIIQNFWKTRVQIEEEEAQGPQTPLARFMEERGLYE
jgi:hypothetical protein